MTDQFRDLLNNTPCVRATYHQMAYDKTVMNILIFGMVTCDCSDIGRTSSQQQAHSNSIVSSLFAFVFYVIILSICEYLVSL